jgi:hypothetical protein
MDVFIKKVEEELMAAQNKAAEAGGEDEFDRVLHEQSQLVLIRRIRDLDMTAVEYLIKICGPEILLPFKISLDPEDKVFSHPQGVARQRLQRSSLAEHESAKAMHMFIRTQVIYTVAAIRSEHGLHRRPNSPSADV